MAEKTPDVAIELSQTPQSNRRAGKKTLLSKWTAVSPQNNEKHFLIKSVVHNKSGSSGFYVMEAVLTKRIFRIDWRDLKDCNQWLKGWR